MIGSEYERLVVHPIAAKWLSDQGYTFWYDRSIGKKLRPDFLVPVHRGAFILECKNDLSNLPRLAWQMERYQQTYGKPIGLSIAIPEEEATHELMLEANQLGFAIIRLVGVLPWEQARHTNPSRSTDWPGKLT